MEFAGLAGLLLVIIGLALLVIGLIGYLLSSTDGGPSWTWALLVSGFGLGVVGIVLLTVDSEAEGKDVIDT